MKNDQFIKEDNNNEKKLFADKKLNNILKILGVILLVIIIGLTIWTHV